MNAIRKLSFYFLAVLFLQSCAIGDIIRMNQLLTNTEVKTSSYISNNKEILFVGMVHIAQEKFYENVKLLTKEAKENGFVLFYEFIDLVNPEPIYLRKVRKMAGFIPSAEGYKREIAEFNIEGLTNQKTDDFLNIVNNKDFRVDVTAEMMVGEYEDKFGEIVLTKDDINVPLKERIGEILPTARTNYIILDYRNKYLAQFIENSEYDKIIVHYGMDHEKGLFEELHKLNASWKKIANN